MNAARMPILYQTRILLFVFAIATFSTAGTAEAGHRLQVLYAFAGGNYGAGPQGNVAIDPTSGVIYGATDGVDVTDAGDASSLSPDGLGDETCSVIGCVGCWH
jgi:hypothetical protein